MDDPADFRLPRIAPLLLLGVLTGLAVVQPHDQAGAAGLAYLLFTKLTAIAVVGYVGWRVHGLIPAAVAMGLLYATDRLILLEPDFGERTFDLVFLGTLALG